MEDINLIIENSRTFNKNNPQFLKLTDDFETDCKKVIEKFLNTPARSIQKPKPPEKIV